MSDYTPTTDFSARDGTTDANAGALVDAEFAAIQTAIATKYDDTDTIPVADGGTGATTAATARSNLGSGSTTFGALTGTLNDIIRANDDTTDSTAPFDSGTVAVTAGDYVLIWVVIKINITSAVDGHFLWTLAEGASHTATGTFINDATSMKIGEYCFDSTGATFYMVRTTLYRVSATGNAQFTVSETTIPTSGTYQNTGIKLVVLKGA